jgi:hypothetical protein
VVATGSKLENSGCDGPDVSANETDGYTIEVVNWIRK